jgi:hypothetical protein
MKRGRGGRGSFRSRAGKTHRKNNQVGAFRGGTRL